MYLHKRKRQFWIPLLVFFVGICALGLFRHFLSSANNSQEPIKRYKRVDTAALQTDGTPANRDDSSNTGSGQEPNLPSGSSVLEEKPVVEDPETERLLRKEARLLREIARREKLIAEQETLIAEQETLIAEQETLKERLGKQLAEKETLLALKAQAKMDIPALSAATDEIESQMSKLDGWMVLENLTPSDIRKRYSRKEIDKFFEDLLAYADLGATLVETYYSYPAVVEYEKIAFPDQVAVWEREAEALLALKAQADEWKRQILEAQK